MDGVIYKATAGFYYVAGGGEIFECRARGHFRHDHITPLVGDRVRIALLGGGKGIVDEILPRKNSFRRPAVANIDQLVLVASAAAPRTDPFLLDRMAAAAAFVGCPGVICINKCDLDPAGELFEIYTSAGLPTVRVSARTGEGMDALASLLAGKTSAFAGNSGVGKSSLINALSPRVSLRVGEVSGKLGRGRHTTRHVELFRLENGAVIADTPGFSSFEEDAFGLCRKEELQYAFPEFASYLGACRFPGCSHRKEKDCAVLAALAEGKISPSRHASYVRLYDLAAAVKEWEI